MYNKKFISLLVLVIILTSITPVFAKDTYNGYKTIGVELNGERLEGDVPAIVMDGRTLVPIRLVSENLGVKVEWNEKANEVELLDFAKNSYSKDMDLLNEYRLTSMGLLKWSYLNIIESSKYMLEYISTLDVVVSDFSELIDEEILEEFIVVKLVRGELSLEQIDYYDNMCNQTISNLKAQEKLIENSNLAQNQDYIKLKESNKILIYELKEFINSLKMLKEFLSNLLDGDVNLTPGTLNALEERAVVDFKCTYEEWENLYSLVYFGYLPNNDKSVSELYQYKDYDVVNVTLNGKNLKGDVPAIIMNDRTLVPLRLISENLGVDVNWVESENKVELKENINIEKSEDANLKEYKMLAESIDTWVRVSNDHRKNNFYLATDRGFFDSNSSKMSMKDKNDFNTVFLQGRTNFMDKTISYETATSNKDFYINSLINLEKNIEKSEYAKNKEYLELKSKLEKVIVADKNIYEFYKKSSTGLIIPKEYLDNYNKLDVELSEALNALLKVGPR